jgi:hypothetical protein
MSDVGDRCAQVGGGGQLHAEGGCALASLHFQQAGSLLPRQLPQYLPTLITCPSLAVQY